MGEVEGLQGAVGGELEVGGVEGAFGDGDAEDVAIGLGEGSGAVVFGKDDGAADGGAAKNDVAGAGGVAVDIAEAAEAGGDVVARGGALDFESVGAVDGGKVEGRAEAGRFPENNIGGALGLGAKGLVRRAEEEVGETVAIDVTRAAG